MSLCHVTRLKEARAQSVVRLVLAFRPAFNPTIFFEPAFRLLKNSKFGFVRVVLAFMPAFKPSIFSSRL